VYWSESHKKSTLDRKEGAIMNGQSRDIATLDPQGTKKRQPNHKNKTQKTKRQIHIKRRAIIEGFRKTRTRMKLKVYK
jgi:hypothetical protein